MPQGSSDGGNEPKRAAGAGSEGQREDFLYHLYRGSDMLMHDRVIEAKEELERALSLQPQDAKSQDLLAGVYFRLGVYPRAIEIWDRLVAAYPLDATLRVNLGLALFKTGQADEAMAQVLSALRIQPDHERAWGYLGLIHWRTGRIEAARDAFLRGGQASMARRMEEMLGHESNADGASSAAMRGLTEIPPASLHPPAPPSISAPSLSIDTRIVAANLPPDAVVRPADRHPPSSAAVPTFAEFLALHELPPGEGAACTIGSNGEALVRGVHGLFARLSSVVGVRCTAAEEPVPRRVNGVESDRSLGGDAPMYRWKGPVEASLSPPAGARLRAFRLEHDTVFVNERALIGFEGSLEHESGLLRVGSRELVMTQLRGRGFVIFACAGTPWAFAIDGTLEARAAPSSVLAWTGRVVPVADSSPSGALALVLRGEGAVVLG